MNPVEAMARVHFNEPVLCGFDVCRLIGYAEDDRDCYYILHHRVRGTIWRSGAAGVMLLTRLAEDMHKLDEMLQLKGIVREVEFVRQVPEKGE